MERVALIESGASDPRKFVYQVYPPSGLMYLASYLRKHHPEVKIKIFDLMLERAPEESIISDLKDFSPQLVGIHAMHFQARSLHRLAQLIKENLGEVVVIAGGPYPTSEPQTVLKDKNIDLAVRGEGEITFLEVFERLRSGRDFSGVKGCAWLKGDELVIEPEREPISDLDQLPFPAWDLICLLYTSDAADE